MAYWTTGKLAEWLGGELQGDSELEILAPARIEDAGPGEVSFIANPKYAQFASTTKASALLVGKDFPADQGATALIRLEDPYTGFGMLLGWFEAQRKAPRSGQNAMAWIAESAQVSPQAWIGAFVSVDEDSIVEEGVQLHPQVTIGRRVRIGKRTVLHPGVTVYDDCKIGDDCVVHAGTIIGSDGFGFAPQKDGTFIKIPQTGDVIVENGVEIGANTTVDRATLGSTVIRSGAKIDNLVQLAHNTDIGNHTVIAAQAGVSGSTTIGKGVMVGGQAGFVGHLKIADGVRVNAQSGVNRSIEQPKAAATGSPAGPYTQELRNQVVYRRLPELEQRIAELEKQLEEKTGSGE